MFEMKRVLATKRAGWLDGVSGAAVHSQASQPGWRLSRESLVSSDGAAAKCHWTGDYQVRLFCPAMFEECNGLLFALLAVGNEPVTCILYDAPLLSCAAESSVHAACWSHQFGGGGCIIHLPIGYSGFCSMQGSNEPKFLWLLAADRGFVVARVDSESWRDLPSYPF